MKLVYAADNGIEAQLVRDILERENIFVRVDGEFLQGAIGELQSMGLVRVLVPKAHYDRAKEILNRDWHDSSELKL
jgi:hypothetical protein